MEHSVYYFYKERVFLETQGQLITQPGNFEENIVPLMKDGNDLIIFECDYDSYVYERDHEEDFHKHEDFNWPLLDKAQITYGIIMQVHLTKDSPLWDRLFDIIRGVNKLTLKIKRAPRQHDWLEHVGTMDVRGLCTPEMFNSGKVALTIYQPWMDVKNNKNVVYVLEDNLDNVDPAIENIEMSFQQNYESMNSFSRLKNLKQVFIKINTSVNEVLEYFRGLDCEVLVFRCDGSIDSLVELDKYPCIISDGDCGKEAVDNSRHLITGYFTVRDVEFYGQYLVDIGNRNRRCLVTKSANKYFDK